MATYLNSTCFTKLKVVKVKSGETINIPIPHNRGLNIIKASSMTSIFFLMVTFTQISLKVQTLIIKKYGNLLRRIAQFYFKI